MPKKKRRAPIEQLRQAGKIARKLLINKGIRYEKSLIDEIVASANAPKLPGIPPYLPHEWTLKAAQRILYDILVIWRDETKDDPKRVENITEFFAFVVAKLREREKKYDDEMKEMALTMHQFKEDPLIKDVFMPMRKKENVKAINHFFVDSFAVSIVLKSNTSVSGYANWFLDWTEELYKFWIKPQEKGTIEKK